MLRFFAQRWWMVFAGALVFASAAIVGVILWRIEGWLAIVASSSMIAAGLGVLAFARLISAIRELFRDTTLLRRDLAEIQQLYADRGRTLEEARVEREALRTRLALTERRLAAVAIKLDFAGALEEGRGHP